MKKILSVILLVTAAMFAGACQTSGTTVGPDDTYVINVETGTMESDAYLRHVSPLFETVLVVYEDELTSTSYTHLSNVSESLRDQAISGPRVNVVGGVAEIALPVLHQNVDLTGLELNEDQYRAGMVALIYLRSQFAGNEQMEVAYEVLSEFLRNAYYGSAEVNSVMGW